MLATSIRFMFMTLLVCSFGALYTRLRKSEHESTRAVANTFALSILLTSLHTMLKAFDIFDDSSMIFQIIALVAQEYGVLLLYFSLHQTVNRREYQNIVGSKLFIFYSISSIVVAVSRYISSNSASFSDNEAKSLSLSYFISNSTHYSMILLSFVMISYVSYTALKMYKHTHWAVVNAIVLTAHIVISLGVIAIITNVALSYYYGSTYLPVLNTTYHISKSIYTLLSVIAIFGTGFTSQLSSKIEARVQRRSTYIDRELRYLHTFITAIVPTVAFDDESVEKDVDDLLLEISDADEVIVTQTGYNTLSPIEYAEQLMRYKNDRVTFTEPGKNMPPSRKNKKKFYLLVAKHLHTKDQDHDGSESHLQGLPSSHRTGDLEYNN